MIICFLLGVLSVLMWLGVLWHPARPWDFQPIGDEGTPPPGPTTWPSVCIVVPARNECTSLPHTLPALLKQDYPGDFSVIVIDDRSDDGTPDIARQVATQVGAMAQLTVVSGASLPDGWVGKVWALEQGAAQCRLSVSDEALCHAPGARHTIRKPDYLLLTDADIRHAPGSLRRLVAESENDRLALNSRMARLRCVSGPEHLLIPAFVFFFNLLYPMRWVNDPHRSVAAAAGGCVLVATAALERLGGFACIKDRIIDDVSLARHIKRLQVRVRLGLSRTEVESLRVYDSVAAIWKMVRRTAFTELRHSGLRLAGTLVGLTLLFVLPPVWLVGGIGAILTRFGSPGVAWAAVLLAAEGLVAWGLMAILYRPAVRFFGLSGAWTWTLPLAGVLYGAMTFDSACRYWTGKRTEWRDR